METKSIGKFIAILRKAKGMTQRDLGDLLNISDKTVSRWEREETLPDVTLIPVLADILGVTSDELLRGERIAAEKRIVDDSKIKQRIEWILNKNRIRYRAMSMIPIALASVGIVAAMISNFIFHKATLGFFCFLGGFIPACLCQCGLYFYYRGGSEVQDMDEELLKDHRMQIKQITLKFSYLLFVLFAACLPLLLFGSVSYADYLVSMGFYTESDVAAMDVSGMGTIPIGLQAKSWMFYGVVFAVVTAGICFLFDSIVRFIQSRNSRRLRYTSITMAVIAVTIIVAFVSRSYLPQMIAQGTRFDTYEDFADYMEEIPDDMAWGIVELRKDNDSWRRQVNDRAGNLVCEYTLYNDNVVKIDYGSDVTKLPITTYTQEDLDEAAVRADRLLWLWGVVIAAECLASITIYRRRGNK